MREVIETVKVFKFSELSDGAKDVARDWINGDGYNNSHEAMDSIKALAEHFGGKMVDWDIDWSSASQSSAKFDMPEPDGDYEALESVEVGDKVYWNDTDKLDGRYATVLSFESESGDVLIKTDGGREIESNLRELSDSNPDGSEHIAYLLSQLGGYDPETLCGNGDCVLTGVCVDEDCIDGFRKAWQAGERDLEKLMQAAFESLLESCEDDYEYQLSDEACAETADANDYEFTESGEFYR